MSYWNLDLTDFYGSVHYKWPYDASKPMLFAGKTWVDTDKYDIVPKKGYIAEQIKAAEKEMTYHENKIDKLIERIESLKDKL